MSASIWQQSKERECGDVYAPRRPTETPLYRVVYEYREELEYRWEELFQAKYGVLRRAVLDAFDAYLNCGVLAHGCARVCCESCNHSELLAFSCKRRGLCPSCDAKRSHIFAEHLHQNVLLGYPHHHTVWTVPKRLRAYFKYNRKLNRYLYLAAWNAWNDCIQSIAPHGKTGAVVSLHSSGDLLNFHPHLHSINLGGFLSEDGTFTEISEFDTELLQKQFAYNLFSSLLKEEVISEELVDSMNNWEHSGFSVFVAPAISADDDSARLFLARYLQKSPISLKRLSIEESLLAPTVRYTKILDDSEEHRDFSPLEFLAELSLNIPDLWEQTSRYYGIYSARARGTKARDELVLKSVVSVDISSQVAETSKKPVSKYWATWIKKIYNVDPLLCPKCGSDMRIKAFVFDAQEIARFTKHLGVAWRAPPKIQSNNSEPYVDYNL